VGRPYRTKSRNLYRLWTGHDLAYHGPEFGSYRPEFYEGLRQEDEAVVWKFIEENYLRKYGSFVRVDFDWMADGLWEIPFPGSVSMGVSVSPENYGMPGPLAARVHAWQANLDTRDPFTDSDDDEGFDYEASNAEGLEIAKEVKLFLGDDYYVEYWPFREISIRDGEAVELEVPAFITGLAR
jgi:hypothetical protein